MTRNVYDLDDRLRGRALSVLARYTSFDADSEHDSGVFIFAGFAFEWRIEYRAVDGSGASPDPADPAQDAFACLRSMPSTICWLITAEGLARLAGRALFAGSPSRRESACGVASRPSVTIPRAYRLYPSPGTVGPACRLRRRDAHAPAATPFNRSRGWRMGSIILPFGARPYALPFAVGITGEAWNDAGYHCTHDRRPVATCRDKPRQRIHPHH